MSMFHIGMSGVRAAKAGLWSASNNLANQKTPGYSRRAALLSAAATGGANMPAMVRLNDAFRTQALWAAGAQERRHKAAQSHLDQLEGVIGASGSDNNLGLGDFLGALNKASADPASTPLRQAVLQAGGSMAKQFNNRISVLENQLRGVQAQRESTIEQVNTLAASVADLNRRIAAGNASGDDVSALMDQRDATIDKLSGLVGGQVAQQPDGTVDITFKGGQPLVLGSRAGVLEVRRNAAGEQELSNRFGTQSIRVDDDELGGELHGLSDFEHETLRPHLQALKTLAGEIADRFNAQLNAGFDKSGAAGRDLFVFDRVSGRMKVDETLTPDDLAFSDASLDPGGNSGNLLRLIELGKSKVDLHGGGYVSLEDALSSMEAKVGAASYQNKTALEALSAVREQAELAWSSASGVDGDEEAINLMEYNKMSQANMTVIKVANELFDKVLNAF
jgi:flagellar hook-associated protein 1 FlgK